MKSKQICIVSEGFLKDSSIDINGTLIQSYIIANEMTQRGIKVQYIALSNAKTNKTQEIIDGIDVHWIKKHRTILSQFYVYYKIWKILKRITPENVYNRGRSYLTYISGKYAKKYNKCFLWASNGENGCEPYKFVPKLFVSKKILLRKILVFPFAWLEDIAIQKGIKWANCVINQTEFQRMQLEKYFNKPGIVIRSIHQIPESIEKSSNPKIVLWFSSLSRGKRPELFIELAKYCADISGWRFELVGGSNQKEYEEQLKRQSDMIPNIKIVGKIDFSEAEKYFSKASIFVNTSEISSEGFPNSFVLAWLHATPVISLDIDPDNLINKEKLGNMVSGRYDELKSSVRRLMSNESELLELSNRCRTFAIEEFALNKSINDYIKLLR